MSDTKLRAESVFNRNQKREAEINDALKQEAARHGCRPKHAPLEGVAVGA
jgi:hypothetical protein